MEALIQMNTRIARDLKQSGDEALALIGFSPSQAVRALWAKASKRGADLEQVALLLQDVNSNASNDRADEVVEQGWELVPNAMRSIGIDNPISYDTPSDDVMLEAEMIGRLSDRGLW